MLDRRRRTEGNSCYIREKEGKHTRMEKTTAEESLPLQEMRGMKDERL